MPDEPDLTAELDAADALVLHDVTTVTEWGVNYAPGKVGVLGAGPDRERWARAEADPGTLVRRTVTYGPWEVVTDA